MVNLFAIYKSKGPTSNDILKRIKRITGIKRVGHGGTLDPLAKGVLVVGVGRQATKKLTGVVREEKEYLATIKLGEKSTTDDAEGAIDKVRVSKIPDLEEVSKAVLKFEGDNKQLPPRFSAVKVKGIEAYKLARSGKDFSLKVREVKIKKIEILNYSWPYLKLKAVTGSGVYMRSLARDIGKVLRVGGYLYDLERIRVGDFTKDTAVPLYKLEEYLLEQTI